LMPAGSRPQSGRSISYPCGSLGRTGSLSSNWYVLLLTTCRFIVAFTSSSFINFE
jgi:hypothetical protein